LPTGSVNSSDIGAIDSSCPAEILAGARDRAWFGTPVTESGLIRNLQQLVSPCGIPKLASGS
jgi:hypothetical protein